LNYSETIAYLHSLTDYEKRRIERYSPETLDLTRVNRLLDALGQPHTRFPSVHIAGTKGKGSTAALIESSLRAAELRTGLYTSPHLHTFRERIQVDGQLIEREDVVTLVEEVRRAIEHVPGITTFEAITAVGFLAFSRADVDIAVVEVGLGGRLDATNVIQPEVSVITSLSLDHTYLLGDTLAEIAYEKGGIVKPDVPVVVAPQRTEALEVLKRIGEKRGAPVQVVGEDWTYEPGPTELGGQSFIISNTTSHSQLEGEYWIPLLGRHQLENSATAIAALDVLRQEGYDISAEAVRDGLRGVHWPGRMEVLSQEPLIVADCAHNPYSAKTLREAVKDWFPNRRWVLIYGASADKDIPGMLKALLPICDYVIVTRSEHPRAVSPVELADQVADAGGGAEISVNVPKAIQRGLDVLKPGQGLLVTGSIFLVAEARAAFGRTA